MIQVELSEDFDPLPNFIFSEITDCITRIFLDFNKNKGFIHLIIVSDKNLRKMKKKYFDVDVFTDVITFNLEDDIDNTEGEIYISWERVTENAQIYQIKTEHEFRRVVIHGTLHLLGFDDQSKIEKSKMTELEDKYLSLSKSFFIT